jgi:polyisoprenoid-binding protein YceI
MEEHFNENYMETDKFPKATFKGKINDLSKINLTADGSYPVQVTGEITIHGVTKTITTPGTISVKSGIITATSTFRVKPADYKIRIPSIVKNNIAEVIDVTVSCTYNQTI